MTEADRQEVLAFIVAARKVAAPVGPLHGLWDLIFDAEALLADRPTVLAKEAVLEELRRTILPAG